MHGRDGQIVVIVLHRQTAGKLAFMMIVDVAECANTVLRGLIPQARRPERLANQVAKGLRAAFIALFLGQAIERVCQIIVDGYR